MKWFSFLNSKLGSDFPTRELLDVSRNLSDTANVEIFADQIPTDSTVRHIWHVSDEAVNMPSLNTFLATTRDSLLFKKATTCFCLSTWKMHSSKKNGEYWCMPMYAVVYRWVGACAGRFPRYNYIHLLAEVLVRFARLLSLRLLLCWSLQWQLEEVLLLHCSFVWFYVLLCFVLVFVVVVVIMVVVFIWVAGCWCLAARFRAGDIALFEAFCKRNRSSSFKHIQTYSICFGFWLLNVEEVEARAWLILDFEQVMLFKLNVPLPEDPFADAEPWQTNQDKGGNFMKLPLVKLRA